MKTNKKRPSQMELELLALTFQERGGREILDRYQSARPNEEMNEGSAYVALNRMRDYGWITIKKDPNGDGRTRLFKITAQGTAAWNQRAAEMERAFGMRPEGRR